MPLISVSMLTGRTPEQKDKLAKALTQAYVNELGVKPQSVQVIMTDVDSDSWAVGGTLLRDR